MSAKLVGKFDAAVLGGGPAGASVARLLAQWGHSVALLTKRATTRALAESLPPSCRKLFATLGVLEAVDSFGFYRSRGNTVWWGSEAERSESFGPGVWGYQILRSDFDKLLLDLAEDSGVAVHRDAMVRQVHLADAGEHESASVDCMIGSSPATVDARWVLDCSGRAGVLARSGLRTTQEGVNTFAIVGVWRRDRGFGLADETHTLVESYEDGWAWSIPTSPSVRYFTVMVDLNVTELAPGGMEAMYRTELAKTVHFSRLTAGAELEDTWGCGASSYSASNVTGNGFVLVGDAASFVDPLSSFGVKKALASAWLAAVVVNTCLSDPKMKEHALQLFETNEREMYRSLRARSATYFRNAAREHQHPFWTARGDAAEDVVDDDVDVTTLREDPEVVAAFAALKESTGIDLHPGESLVLEMRPAVEGVEVVLEQFVVTATAPSGMRFLRGVNLPKLIAISDGHREVPDLFDAYNSANEPVPLPDFLGALSVLLAKGALDNRRG